MDFNFATEPEVRLELGRRIAQLRIKKYDSGRTGA